MVDVVTQDEGSQVITFVILLMNHACSFRSDWRNSTKQREPIVLNLQFQSLQRNAWQVSLQDQSLIGLVNVDGRRKDVSIS